jgi:predicted amidohydrolase
MIRVALIQMLVEGGLPDANLRRAGERIARAADQGAQVVVLPETFDAGWTHPSARTAAEPIPDGRWCLLLRESARRHGVYVCAGLTERKGDRLFNAAVLIGPGGEALLHHRKLNELDIARDLYAQGDRLGVVHAPLGTVGVMICADAFARGQVVSRTLGLMGAQLILSPGAWAVPADHDDARDPYGQIWLDNYVPVAREHRLWIAGVSNVGWLRAGPWAGRKCIGSSLLIRPDGRVAVRGPYGADAEAVLIAEVALERHESRSHPD